MKTLIIEDEPIAAKTLHALVKEIRPDAKVLGVLQAVDESVEWFRQNPMPDLVFMDIHLADGSSFSIFDEADITCPIIFITAYDSYALKAFEVNSIDYLLKPIDKKELERAITKYEKLSLAAPQHSSELLSRLLASVKQNSQPYKSCFLVPEKDKLIPLAVADIAYMYVENKTVQAFTRDGKGYYMDSALHVMMSHLDPSMFFRANRQFVIARSAIKDMSQWFGGKLSVNLTISVPERVIISKQRVGEFKQWFMGLPVEGAKVYEDLE